MRGFNVTSRPPWFSGSLKITEREFYEELAGTDPDSAAGLPAFFDRCRALGLVVAAGDAAMVIQWLDADAGKVVFATILKDGRVDTRYVCSAAREIGDRPAGEAYLDGMASLLGDAAVLKKGSDLTWRVTRDGELPPIRDLLAVSGRWLALIARTMDRLREAAHGGGG